MASTVVESNPPLSKITALRFCSVIIPFAGWVSSKESRLPNCAASFELKSLKDYLFTYPKLGVFQENVVNPVLENVAKACEPVWAVANGGFRPEAASRRPSRPGGHVPDHEFGRLPQIAPMVRRQANLTRVDGNPRNYPASNIR